MRNLSYQCLDILLTKLGYVKMKANEKINITKRNKITTLIKHNFQL